MDFLCVLGRNHSCIFFFRCWIDGIDSNDTVADWNSTEILNAIPLTSTGLLDNCYIKRFDNKTETCNKWVYDRTYYTSSRAIELDFVCHRRWMGAIAQTAFMMGVFVGAIVLGGMADRFGRKKIFCWSAVMQLILGISVAFAPEYWSFIVLRFIYGIFGAGSYLAGFVLTMELVGPSKRNACGVIFPCSFATGVILVAGWGALITDRMILQIIYGLHSIIILPHIWIMDESPRWLWAQGRSREAVVIVEKALKFNKSNKTLDRAALVSRGKMDSMKNPERPSANTLDLFKTPYLRKKTLNICFCWFANSIVYYGLSLSSGNLKGNPYFIIALFGLVEYPSYFAVIYLLGHIGRRALVSSMTTAGGLACIIASLLPIGSIESTAIAILGKLFIAGSFAIVYIYSAELFPTTVRNSGVGLGSMCARLSAAATPLITLLDSFNPIIPRIIFGIIAVVSGFLCFFLPETMNKEMPQTLSDGEHYGKGDTCFSCLGTNENESLPDKDLPESRIPLSSREKS